MRDRERIPRIISLLEKIWKKNIDLRLCQLLGNCFAEKDLYYIEDDILESALKEIYNVR